MEIACYSLIETGIIWTTEIIKSCKRSIAASVFSETIPFNSLDSERIRQKIFENRPMAFLHLTRAHPETLLPLIGCGLAKDELLQTHKILLFPDKKTKDLTTLIEIHGIKRTSDC